MADAAAPLSLIHILQRDYMAGEVSKDLTRRMLLPQEIVEAHEAGTVSYTHLARKTTVLLRSPSSAGW